MNDLLYQYVKGIDFKKLVKLKVIGVSGNKYFLEDNFNNKRVKCIEFYGAEKPYINDYIYISDKIIREVNIFCYGEVFDINRINCDEIIKIEKEDYFYYLQRYYG